MGFETPEEGYLAKIILPAGTKSVPIGKLVCIIVSDQASVAAFKDFKDDGSSDVAPTSSPSSAPTPAAAPPTPAPAAPKSAPIAPPSPPVSAGDRIFASPLAKKLAAEKGLSLQVIVFFFFV